MTNPTTPNRSAVLLLVDDNDNDAELTKLGFAQSTAKVELHHVSDGEECMLFLRKSAYFVGAPTPDLILLDLHMPRMNGLEVLEALSHDEQLRHIPVIVLTTSDAPSDVQAAYRLRCSSYIVKPVGFAAFITVIEALCSFWLNVATLPRPTLSQETPATHRTTFEVQMADMQTDTAA